MWVKRASLLLVAAALFFAPRAALAWVEAHVEADDVHVTLEADGKGSVEHLITLKIAGGPLRSLDLHGVEADAVVDPEALITPQREARWTPPGGRATAELMPPDKSESRTRDRSGSIDPLAELENPGRVLRLRFPDKGLGRGIYVIRVRYATGFASRIERRGRMVRVTYRGVAWADDGLDNARVTFDLPGAPNAPRAEDAPAAAESAPAERGAKAPGAANEPNATAPPHGLTDADDDGKAPRPLVLSTVRRGPGRDQIELQRPYVPRGEAVAWSFEADALAFAPLTTAPKSAPKSLRARVIDNLGEPAQRSAAIGVAAALFLVFVVAIAKKSSEVTRAARAAGVAPRPLVPWPTAVRALLGGAALTAGVAVEVVLSRATLGAVLVGIAAAFAAHRTPRAPASRLRGPGRWLPLATADAFARKARPTGAWLDVSTLAGKALFFVALAALGGVVALVADFSPFRAELVALDAVVILALFATGRLAELPPDPALAAAPRLGRVAALLDKALNEPASRSRPAISRARLVARIRVPDGADAPDEMRLVARATSPAPGFGSIEIGYVFVQGPGGAIGLPEVLVRFTEGSACEVALAGLARAAKSSRGRKADERVLAFRPRLPTAKMTAALAARLVRFVSVTSPSSGSPAAVRRAA